MFIIVRITIIIFKNIIIIIIYFLNNHSVLMKITLISVTLKSIVINYAVKPDRAIKYF